MISFYQVSNRSHRACFLYVCIKKSFWAGTLLVVKEIGFNQKKKDYVLSPSGYIRLREKQKTNLKITV